MVAPGRLGSKRAPVLCLPHPEQSAHGIAASDEPVSTIRLKVLWSAPRQTLAAKYPSVFRLPSSRQPSDTAVSRRPTRSGPCPCGWKLRRVNEWFVLTAPTNEAEGLMLVIIIGFDELETARHRHSATTRVALHSVCVARCCKTSCEAIISVRARVFDCGARGLSLHSGMPFNLWVRRCWRSAVAGTGDPQISNSPARLACRL